MRVLIIGSEGSMGKRYQAILRFMDIDFVCADKEHSLAKIRALLKLSTHIIIATPTDTHLSYLVEFASKKKPILCEKPLVKNKADLMLIKRLVEGFQLDLTMMMQYKLLDDPKSQGISSYNYFRHGSDGLFWDCLQIVGLARGPVILLEKSPVWRCELNGKKLSLADMDGAYLSFVNRWLHDLEKSNIDHLIQIHEKVLSYESSH